MKITCPNKSHPSWIKLYELYPKTAHYLWSKHGGSVDHLLTEAANRAIKAIKGNNKITSSEISNLIKQEEIEYLDEEGKPCKNWTK